MKKGLFEKFSHCRFCLNKNLAQVIDLGVQPAANAFLSENQLREKEPFFPLKVNFCSRCGQLQLTHVVSPDYLFRNYVYVSSTSPVFIAHFEDYAKNVYNKLKLNRNSFVVDIGSNDGILLKPFKKLGTKILGVDPAIKIAKEATKKGLKTLPEYFTQSVAEKIIKKYGYADVICANNVFAHVPYIDELILAIKKLLNENGVLVIEAPYLVVFLQNNLFDTIYHEHVSYLAIRPLTVLFRRFDMEVFDVERTDSHGGSIRVYVKKSGAKHKIQKSVEKLIALEESLGLNKTSTFTSFNKKIERNKEKLRKLVKKIKSKGKSIVGYGAPAKGNTLLNYFKIGKESLDYIVDDSEYKHNLYTPGTHILVRPSTEIKKNRPDYILILAWNFADSIMNKLSDYRESGGKFIIPVPLPREV